jgi:hypothetical protein
VHRAILMDEPKKIIQLYIMQNQSDGIVLSKNFRKVRKYHRYEEHSCGKKPAKFICVFIHKNISDNNSENLKLKKTKT